MDNKMRLKYSSPAPIMNEDARYACGNSAWEKYSLPLGNGYFGANVFGRTVTERIQISEPTLCNPWYRPKTVPKKGGAAAAGVNNFAEIYIDIGHENVESYERGLSIENSTAYVRYKCGEVKFKREYFASFPDKLLAVKFSADKSDAVSLKVRAEIPFLGEYTVEQGDGLSKYGRVVSHGNSIILRGKMEYYGIEYFGLLTVKNYGGKLVNKNGFVCVTGADEVVLYFSCDTNYKLLESVFSEPRHENKLNGLHVDEDACRKIVSNALKRSYKTLRKRHVDDYRKLYSRVSLNINDLEDSESIKEYTDVLLKRYKEGKPSKYLETLLFQYGRYLLISSSRTRLPAHLQGIWNAYCDSPWSCGYWHNINVQMNYWLTGPANLAELFVPYINYAKAYMKSAEGNADEFIKQNYPEQYSGDGDNGWIIWTACWAYEIERLTKLVHSGPGTGAFTSLLFWDYYDYTRDVNFLREFGYPALLGMSRFFTKALIERDGKYLIRDSASPEVLHGGKYYITEGCAFDQQMVYENFKRTLEAAEILGISDAFTEKIAALTERLDPVLIGDDGQVKEFREETGYCSIGDEPRHRHISHLVGLYPGTIINDNNPDWLEGAKITLQNRGDKSGGWSIAHRLLLWARVKEGSHCKTLIDSFIRNNVYDNLWDIHPPFQIDGNFGYTAGVCEMLLQSHAGYIELLPALPADWESGSFSGLVARGNFEVSCEWLEKKITRVMIIARAGGHLKIKLPNCKSIAEDESNFAFYEKEMAKNEKIELELQ